MNIHRSTAPIWRTRSRASIPRRVRPVNALRRNARGDTTCACADRGEVVEKLAMLRTVNGNYRTDVQPARCRITAPGRMCVIGFDTCRSGVHRRKIIRRSRPRAKDAPPRVSQAVTRQRPRASVVTNVSDTVGKVEIIGGPQPETARVLTPEPLAFVARLHRAFNPTRLRLLQARADRQTALDAGARPDLLAETAGIRAADWRVAPRHRRSRSGTSRSRGRPTGR